MKNRRHWAKDRKIKKHQKEQYNFLRLVSHIFLVVFLVILVYVIVYSKFFKINIVSIYGIKTIGYDKVESSLSNFLDGRYLGIVPRGNFLFLSQDSVEDLLLEEFKKVKSVRVKKSFPDEIDVYVTERDSLLLWCLQSECYMIDEDGKAYERVNSDSLRVSEDHLIRLRDMSNKSVNEGDEILSRDYAEFVLSVKNEIWNNFGLCVSNEFITSSRLAEEVVISVVDGWQLYLDSSIPIEKSISTLGIFFNESISMNDSVDLEYIDLRIEDKIFYKMKGDDIEEDEVETRESSVESEDVSEIEISTEEKKKKKVDKEDTESDEFEN
ncbi:cell division protein FtsQ/DivIB [Patescibacteria group bacterium]